MGGPCWEFRGGLGKRLYIDRLGDEFVQQSTFASVAETTSPQMNSVHVD